ncbi:MAG: FHA domain-containing protein [Anaerolineae bacterium]|nr:FHA domain-containing protein [Anaerolineae bacterium]
MYQLVIRTGPTTGKVFPLDMPEMIMGRDPAVQVSISSPEISRRHARIYLQGQYYVVEDMGSLNGTTVNGQRLAAPASLRPGDVIGLGDQVSLVFEAAGAAATVASPGRQVPPPPTTPPQQPQPAYVPPRPAPPPPPAYANQPPPTYSEPVAEGQKKKFPTALVIVLVAVLVLMCICVVVGFAIDSTMTPEEYCNMLPFWPWCP